MSRIFLLEKGDRLTYPNMKIVNNKDLPYDLEVIDRKLKLYRSGKIYVSYLYKDLDKVLVKEMQDNIKDKLDNIVIVVGPEGVGKSHNVYHFCKLLDATFDMRKRYVYEYEEFLERVVNVNAPPGSVFWLDEASNIASNRDWMHSDNKQFIKVLEMFRSRGWILFLTLPSLERLDVYIRENRARYIIRTAIMSWDLDPARKNKRRGYFHVTRVDFSGDTRWEQKIGYGQFPPIPEPDASIYEELKLQSQQRKIAQLNEAREKSEKGGGRMSEVARKNRALMLKLSEDGYSNEAIAGIVGMTVDSVTSTLVKARKEHGIDE